MCGVAHGTVNIRQFIDSSAQTYQRSISFYRGTWVNKRKLALSFSWSPLAVLTRFYLHTGTSAIAKKMQRILLLSGYDAQKN